MDFFRKADTAQLGHQRRQYVTATRRLRHQPGERVRRVLDVGIGEQKVFRLGYLCCGNALTDRPQFPGPAGCRPCCSDDPQPSIPCGSVHGNGTGAIVAIVVDDGDRQRPAIVLQQQRPDAVRDAFGFVARGNNHGNRRPDGQRFDGRGIARTCAPISAPRTDQVGPNPHANDCNYRAHRRRFSG